VLQVASILVWVIRLTGMILSVVPMARADALGGEVLLLTAHVSDETIQLGRKYKNRLSSDGRFVLTLGLELYYERSADRKLLEIEALRFTVAGYLDSMNHFAGYLALTPRWVFAQSHRALC
jgi:hypothetical protein